MLAGIGPKQAVAGDCEPLQVMLPEHMQSFFNESGYQPTTASEFRGNARLNVRAEVCVKFTETPAMLKAIPGQDIDTGIGLLKDLSKTGIGLLYHRQLFPCQKLEVDFQGRRLHAVVVRCRRLGEKCYEVGGRILGVHALPSLDDDQTFE